ncbi:MAG: aminoacyl-tRNA hydrolase [Oscillospiraceae bacterium]|nr:aminoacyl-tRNA hydrolase [Oscillospiraceae bacterium]MDE6657727.1 aminoacyl-tRNA hydrolase [Oscillospiraceae bacterium]
MGIMDIFAQLEQNKLATGKPQWLIVGLGNPSMIYENTRHNAGFMAIDTLANQEQVQVNRMKFKSYCTDLTLAEQRCLLLKPQTYMNNSGEAVVQAMQFYKIDISQVIIIFDDISLPVGKLRIRRKGSAGGHNGIKSIIELTGSEDFARIKLGVGKKPNKNMNLADWVLSKFTDKELLQMQISCANACECLKLMLNHQTEKAMNLYNA